MALISKLRIHVLEANEPAYMVAARAGFSPSRLSEYMLGRRDIPTHHVIALCEVLNCLPDEIIGWDSDAVVLGEREPNEVSP